MVDDIINRRLHSEVALINRVTRYILTAGGKRLRPALVILSANALNYQGQFHHELAAVIEFIHTATLLHDDVVDGSELRRGQVAANAVFGNSASVLVGDFLYSRAFELMLESKNTRVMEVLASATNVIAAGEVMQLMNCGNPELDEESYLNVIRAKTAKLFEAAAQLGAVLANTDADQERALAKYGMHLGTAFQLIDDVLDYSGDQEKTGKNIGDDLAEGKSTLPLIYAMTHGTKDQRDIIRCAIVSGGQHEFGAILQAVTSTGALEYGRNKAREESRAALAALALLTHSKYKDSLLQLAEFAVARAY